MEFQGELCGALHVSPRFEPIKKRALVEVFAMQIIVKPSDPLQIIHGFILLKSSDQISVIYEDPCDERGPQFDSKGQLILSEPECNQFDSGGQLILSGPECGVEVKDTIIIYPWLFDKYLSSCYRSKGNILWKRDACRPQIDQFIRRGVSTRMALLQVDFAVYGDGVEAHLEVFLSDLKFDEKLLQSGNAIEVYGTIKASNSALIQPEAKSGLFHHMTSREGIKVSNWPPREAEICVPLTRSVTVIPREAALIVDACLSLSCTPQDVPTAVGSAVFDAKTRSNCTVEEQVIHGGHAKVKVRVTWSI